MTFIPNSITITDDNNSAVISNLAAGTVISTNYTSTTGYNTVILNINSTKDGKIQVVFSSDQTTQNVVLKDTYFANTFYSKNYKILNKYYKIIYTNGSFIANITMNTLLSTALDEPVNPNLKKNINNFSLDAFGKLRVTNPNTLLDIKFPGQSTGSTQFLSNSEMVCTKKNTGSSSSISCLKSVCTMSVSANNDYCISQSRKYCVYQPGKSQLFLASGIINAGDSIGNDSTTSSRIGYFDDNNGMFFEYSNSTLKVVVRKENSNVLGTPVEQINWNIDKMDGYGPSGLTLNLQYSQLFVIDFEWLGVGKLRFGFYANGIINYCHEITNINYLDGTYGPTYTLTANLPIRYEIRSTGGTGKLKQICSTVISEGGYNPIGKPFSISTGYSSISLTANTEKPLLAIRGLTSTYNHENIFPTGLDFIVTSPNDNVLYKVILFQSYNPVSPSSWGTWTPVNSNYSITEYITSPTNVTTSLGIIIDQGYSYGKTSVSFSNLSNVFNNLVQITSDLDGVSDILLITGTSTGAATVFCSLSWQEIY